MCTPSQILLLFLLLLVQHLQLGEIRCICITSHRKCEGIEPLFLVTLRGGGESAVLILYCNTNIMSLRLLEKQLSVIGVS